MLHPALCLSILLNMPIREEKSKPDERMYNTVSIYDMLYASKLLLYSTMYYMYMTYFRRVCCVPVSCVLSCS